MSQEKSVRNQWNAPPCPYCGARSSWVADSRGGRRGTRRRRQCHGCTQRFTTYEMTVPDTVTPTSVPVFLDGPLVRTITNAIEGLREFLAEIED